VQKCDLVGLISRKLKDDGSRPVTGNHRMVEAGGQYIRSFRCGLDYAFIRAGFPAWMRSVLCRDLRGILVSAQSVMLAANL